MNNLTADRLCAVLDYDPSRGIFVWKSRASNRIKVGQEAGSTHGSGYTQINVDGQNYLAHRLAWLYVHGEWPKHVIDHINGDRKDNRIENLRDVPHPINAQNIRRPMSTNTSGFLGVSWSRKDKSYVAHISVQNRTKCVGAFRSAIQAHDAYLSAKRKVHAGCTI